MQDEQQSSAPAEQEPISESTAIEAPDAPTPPDPEGPRSRREALEKAFADVDATEAPETEKPVAQTDEQGRLRGPDGKFVSKDGDEKTDSQSKEATSKQAEEKPLLSEPPSRFSQDAKEAWKDAPASVQGEIKRAIDELESGLAQKDEQIAPLKPYFELAQRHGVTVHDTLDRYINMEQLLARDLRQGLTAVAQNFGMTLDDMIAQATGQQPPEGGEKDREILSLRNELVDLKQQVQGVSTNIQQNQYQQVQNQVVEFAESHPRFDELAPEIQRLLETGYASGLEDAYEKAERLNPAPPPVQPAPAAPAQTRPQRSVTGAPSAGSNPNNRQPSANRSEALKRAFAATGLS